MVTKATRDVVDLNTREVIDGLRVSGDNSANFSINGTVIGATLPADGTFVNIGATNANVSVNLTVGTSLDVTGATVTGLDIAPPVGAIIMFNGTFASIPANWQLCDGTNGTPDMTDQFVYGTNIEGELLDSGGQADAIIPNHTHPISDPGHRHTDIGRALGDADGTPGGQGFSGSHNTGNATTGISINNPTGGEDVTDKNLPPFIKLAFIQRIS